MRLQSVLTTAALVPGMMLAAEISQFRAYVDSDICARIMLGPITENRVNCSKSTAKDGAEPVLVRLSNNMVFTVNKQKMINPLVGQLAEVSGEAKVKNGTIKLDSVNATTADKIPAGDPERRLLDVRTYKTTGGSKVYEKIRHELAMMPYISEFDFISFTMVGYDVVLTGWTVRATNRDTAYNIVKNVEGVERIVNNILVLPLGSIDMRIRGAARAALQRQLSRYFWGSGSDIKIIVKDGQIILLGSVIRQADKDLAFMQCNQIPGVFKVFNLLRVVEAPQKGSPT